MTPRVLALYVGGTIGMQRNEEHVLVPVPNAFIQKVKSNSELHDPGLVDKYYQNPKDNELVLPPAYDRDFEYSSGGDDTLTPSQLKSTLIDLGRNIPAKPGHTTTNSHNRGQIIQNEAAENPKAPNQQAPEPHSMKKRQEL
ncbi:hypothetical protein JTB14_026824 [Gonioctena quinquepunctata]|nr:hypothetical protein JTB14_026824 [Gonioctena quinquepunctata]